MPEATATTEEELQKHIQNLGPWFHNIHLAEGVETAPDHFLGDFPTFKWKEISGHIPDDLSNYRVLDVGCNAGYYSFELAKRGARVTGMDLDPHYLKQARWAAQQLGLSDRVEFKQQQVYDLARTDETYDIVWFMGVFYHLRYPLLALDILAEKTNELLVMQTLSMPGKGEAKPKADYNINEREEMLREDWPKMAFIEGNLNGDPTNWWAANYAGIKAMLRSAGLEITAEPADETFVCKPHPERLTAGGSWNRSEYLSAIGKDYQQELSKKISGKS